MTLTGTGLDVAGRLDAGSANIAGNLDLGGRVAASGEIVSNSSIAVDTANTNNGTFSPGIRFGNAGSKEGISSKRTPGNTRSNGLSFYTNEVERMLILNDGRIGIGTTDPRAALHIAKDYGSRQEWEEYRLYWPVGPAIYDQTTDLGGNNGRLGVLNDFPLTLYCEGWTAAIGYFAISDERIKKVSRLSNPTKDLEVLNKIEITDYTFIDQIAQGPGESKKVIAQQVEEVFPQAISKSTGVVPDIFKKATFENGWIMLATDLKKGEKVKLMTPTKTAVYKVLEVKEGRFRTAMNSSQNEVFVYGREVNDFRSVDYDGISMLNVSATQELHRLLEAKTKEIEVMKKEMAALKGLVSNLQTKDETRESRLIAIEKLLTRDREPVKTASK
jgi:hypothetical protein